MVRLKFDDVEKTPKIKKIRRGKKPKDRDASDFDSEEEYGKEGDAGIEDASDAEMDDGKTPVEDDKSSGSDKSDAEESESSGEEKPEESEEETPVPV